MNSEETNIEVPESISPLISSNIIQFINNEFNDKLKNISHTYGISYDDLIRNYSLDLSKLAIKLGMKKRNRRVLNTNQQCMGRKIDGARCTRSRRENCEYCLSHLKSLPQGRIDDDVFANILKNKNLKKKKVNEYEENSDYIAFTVEMIEGQTYLVNPITREIYSYDLEHPTKVGILTEQQTIQRCAT